MADKPARSPMRWLFDGALLLLGAALALNWALCLFAQVWLGLVIIAVVAVAVTGIVNWWRLWRRRW
ncbi:hypothetical protein [Arthrobacter sp. ERGS1:01]|uniref:hypothetical protein n=1 Tax=Arthrobacter sp. ERGS1:01 TaxID=1704044 RepID=UPI00123799D4|nr:hypothetical protein [Arthrobacter sp. ERGS1:01]